MSIIFYSNRYILCLILCILVMFSSFSQESTKDKEKQKYIVGPNVGKKAFIPEEYAKELDTNIKEYTLPWIVSDRDLDGNPDFATLIYPGSYLKKMEVMDLDYDGIIDDFIFFDKQGEVSYQIIDHNRDGKADLWIQVKKGKFVQRFQRDKNGDGLVDIDRVFDATVLF